MIIRPPSLRKLLVAALLYHFALFDDHNVVGVFGNQSLSL